MAVYDVELLSVPADVSLDRASEVLGLSEASVDALFASLPAVVAERMDESEAEVLFHRLTDLGAQVKLQPVVGAPSRRPSSRPASMAPPSPPSRPPVSAIPPAPAVPSFGGPSAPPVEPIDLDDFELPAMDDGLDIEAPVVGGSWHPRAESVALELDGPAPVSSPPPSGPVDVRRPVSSRPPPGASQPASTQPAPAGHRPVVFDEGTPVPEGNFYTDILWSYVYPLRPKVLGMATIAALPILALSLPKGGLFGLFAAFFFALLKLGVTGVFAFWLMRHAYLGREGDLPQSSDMSRSEPLTDQGMRIMLICLPMVVVSLFGSSPWIELFLVAWTLYLPAAFILAFFGSGWFGGMNLIGGVRLIMRVPGQYTVLFFASLPLFVAAFLTFFLVSGGSALAIMAWSGAIYLLTGLVAVLYMLSVAALARMLGRFMLRYEDEIGIG